MASDRLAGVLRRLRRETAVGGSRTPPDRDLLARFSRDRDGGAFAALVARHGPMVLGVCKRVLGDQHAAEDAFQATFLVLARRAGAVRDTELLGNWLYGVAYRVASRARVEAARRRARERGCPLRPPRDPLAEITVRELLEVLDLELHRLPDGCRAALVACYLAEKTREEAAAELGWSPATLGRRLARGRELLRARLARRGLSLAVVLFPAALGSAVSAEVPASLTESTARAAVGFAAGSTPAVPSPGASTVLAEGVLKTMSITKLKIATALLVTVAFVAVVGVMPHTGAVAGPGRVALSKPVAAPVAPANARLDPPRADSGELQGIWTLTETHTRGTKVAAANVWLEPTNLVIAGNRVTMLTHPGSEAGTVEADPRANPKEYTFNFKKPQVGIYAVDGDTLKLCFNPANGIRPADFTTAPDSDRVLCVFKRQPAGPADLHRLQGTWELAETRYDGKAVIDNRQGLIAHARLVFEGHWLTLPALREGTAGRRSKVEIDEAARPKRITFDWYGGRALGVYTLDGDTFQFCYEHGGKAPPTEFGAGPGSKNLLLVYKRPLAAKEEAMTSSPQSGGDRLPAAGSAKTDLQKLQGTWVLDAVAPDRTTIKPPHSKLEIDGHEFTMHLLDGGSGHHHSKLQINETTNPRRITFDWLGGQAHGIYQIDGDTFTFCYTPGAKAAPAEWGVGPAKLLPKGNVVLIYKREPRAAAGNSRAIDADTKERDAAEALSQPLSPREAVEKYAGKEVRVVFRVASAYSIFGGSVPRGQLPPFGLVAEGRKDDPRFSVLVSGELVLMLDRLGVSQLDPGKYFTGKTIEVVGKIERFDPPEGAPDGKPSHRLAVSDWRKFRIVR